MGVQIIVREDQPLQKTLQSFRRRVDLHCRRSCYKTRFGYYEKLSIRRKRKRKLQARNRRLAKLGAGVVRGYMGLGRLCTRASPQTSGSG